MSRVRVKVCGVTSVDDARAAVDAGADAIGLNCFSKSARFIDVERVAAIVEAVEPFVTTVAVFVNPSPESVREVVAASNVDRLQFHGDETAAFCGQFSRRYVKALGVGADFDFDDYDREFADADGFILDAYAPNERGGTGHTFNWSQWPTTQRTLALAGGLDPDNVGDAIRSTGTRIVDVASGVELDGDKRVKDRAKLERFMAAVRRVESAT